MGLGAESARVSQLAKKTEGFALDGWAGPLPSHLLGVNFTFSFFFFSFFGFLFLMLLLL
jgi:hypothetical protein